VSAIKNPAGARSFKYSLHEGDWASILNTSKQSAVAMTTPLYTKPITSRKPIVFINALFSLKHCEKNADLSLTFKKADQNDTRLALLIFKSGLNRIKLTELRSGAATPKKMFLMLAKLSEITEPECRARSTAALN
jgi:hypothetical protein